MPKSSASGFGHASGIYVLSKKTPGKIKVPKICCSLAPPWPALDLGSYGPHGFPWGALGFANLPLVSPQGGSRRLLASPPAPLAPSLPRSNFGALAPGHFVFVLFLLKRRATKSTWNPVFSNGVPLGDKEGAWFLV